MQNYEIRACLKTLFALGLSVNCIICTMLVLSAEYHVCRVVICVKTQTRYHQVFLMTITFMQASWKWVKGTLNCKSVSRSVSFSAHAGTLAWNQSFSIHMTCYFGLNNVLNISRYTKLSFNGVRYVWIYLYFLFTL